MNTDRDVDANDINSFKNTEELQLTNGRRLASNCIEVWSRQLF